MIYNNIWEKKESLRVAKPNAQYCRHEMYVVPVARRLSVISSIIACGLILSGTIMGYTIFHMALIAILNISIAF